MALGHSAKAAQDRGSRRAPAQRRRLPGRPELAAAADEKARSSYLSATSAGLAHAQAAPATTPGPPRGEAGPAPAPPPAGGATPRPRVRARPRATRLGVRGAAEEAGPGGRQKMARVCRRQQCSVERRGFRQELDSWRHKLIHCVGETLPRPLPALGPPRHRLPRTREGAGAEAIAAPARPPSLARASPSPSPPECGRAQPPGGLSPVRPEHARRPLPSARLPRGGLSGGSACPFLPPASLPTPPAWRPRVAAGLLWRLAPRCCHLTGGAASGSGELGAGVGGTSSAPSARSLPPPTPPLPHARRRAPQSPRARAAAGGRTPGARACARREVEMGAEGAGAVTGPGSA